VRTVTKVDDARPPSPRQAWHYDAIVGRPEWSKQLARLNVIQRERQRQVDRSDKRPARKALEVID
jgi:hypothetical protein